MIQILNISKKSSPFGVHRYSVLINKDEVCQFEHRREDGLAECLRQAAKAVDTAKWMLAMDLLKEEK